MRKDRIVEKENDTKECAEFIRQTLVNKGKVVSDFNLGYMLGRVDADTERKEMYEAEERPVERELPEPKADSQTPGDLSA